MANDELKTASVLAFERKLDPSDALMFSSIWGRRDEAQMHTAIPIREKSVRGTISNRLKAKEQDPAKLDAKIENPNLQTVDVAALPGEDDTLIVRFTLRVLGGTGSPSACNNAAYQDKLKAVVDRYCEQHGFSELAHRYATNLANGRFLWRNRVGAEQVEVTVHRLEMGERALQWKVDASVLPIRDFSDKHGYADNVKSLSDHIRAALSGEQNLLLEVVAAVQLGAGQEVFPSQELVLGNQDKSKTLYQVSDIAGIHSQKLGNALRTIDTWYPKDDSKDVGPIAVEPYGSVTTQGTAFRQPKQKVDFYSLLDKWVLKDEAPSDVGNKHFVMATLVRGGVFGEGGVMLSHYVEIQILPDPEFPAPVLMSALFSKLHRVLVNNEQSSVGISFPEYSFKPRTLGSTLRLHSEAATLESLMRARWMKGLAEYAEVNALHPVPERVQYCIFKRRQFKTNVERLRRRRMKRHGEDYEQAASAVPSSVAQQPELPFATVRSQSTQQRFNLFVERSDTLAEPIFGPFNYYGLSDTATVPWF